MNGIVVKSTGSWYTVKTDSGPIQARLRGKFKLENKKITNPIAVGDKVGLTKQEDDFVISNVYDRENYVVRSSPRKKGHDHMIAANIDQAILIGSYRMPKTSLGFIDRFFVTLEAFRISGFVIINKTDIYNPKEMIEIDSILDMYRDIGYEGKKISVLNDDLDEIINWLTNKTTLLAGHSGTGKSTFINKIIPDANQQIKEVSKFASKGIHTTTFAEMFEVNSTSFIIDTPGIKELGLAEIEQYELSHYFPEMREMLGHCKYHNCIHLNEPGCVILEAVKEGAIDIRRYDSYLSMLIGEDNRR